MDVTAPIKAIKDKLTNLYNENKDAIERAARSDLDANTVSTIKSLAEQTINVPIRGETPIGKLLEDDGLVAAAKSFCTSEECKKLDTTVEAWKNVQAHNTDGKPAGPVESSGSPATGGSTGGDKKENVGAASSDKKPSDSKGSEFWSSALENIGSLASGTLSLFSGIGSALGSLFKSGYDPSAVNEKIEAFKSIAAEIDSNNALSDEDKDKAYRSLVSTVAQQTGMDDETASGITSFMFDTLKMPVKTVAYGITESGNFLKELFTPQARYNIYDPLNEQAVDRYLKSYRDTAVADVDAKQNRFGVQNLMKFGFSEEEATKFAEYAKNPMAKQLLQTGGQQIFRSMFKEKGDELWAKVKGNIDGVLYGFQGDGNKIFNQLSGDTFSQTKLESFGAAASILTATPSYKTGYARAQDYTETLRGMQASGWDASAYVVRGDDDVRRNMKTLEGNGRLDAAKERYVAKKREEAMEKAFEGLTPEQIKAAKESKSDFTGKPVYKEDGSIDLVASLGENTTVAEYITEKGDEAATQAESDFIALRDGGGDTRVSKQAVREIGSEVTGQIIADLTQERTTSEMQVAHMFNRVRGAKEAFGGKELGVKEAQQLIRLLGDSDVNGNYGSAADRSMMIGAVAIKRDIDLKTMTSAVSLAGETAKKMGMDQSVTQQAAELGFMMFDNRMSNLGPGVQIDANRALAQSMQNAVRVLNGRNYGNLVWLQRLGANGRFKEDATGNKFSSMAKKLQNGEELTSEEWDLLNNDSKRQEAFNGSTAEYNTSRTMISQWSTTMNADEKRTASLGAIRRERDRVFETMDWRTGDDWKRSVSAEIGKDTVAEVYGTESGMRDLYMTLLKRFSPEDAIKIMSGQRSLSSKDRKLLLEAVDGDEKKFYMLTGMLDRAGNMEPKIKQQVGLAFTNASSSEAKANGFNNLQELGNVTAYQDPKNTGFIATMNELTKLGLTDKNAPIIERVLGRSDTAGGRVAAFIGEMFAATADPKMVTEQFNTELVGLRGILTAGAMDAIDGKEYFKQVWGTSEKGWEELRDNLKGIDESLDGMTQEEAFEHIQKVFSDPKQAELQKKYAKALSETDFGKAVNEMFMATTEEERKTAWANAKKAANANGIVLTGPVPPETVTPASEGPSPASGPPSTAPAPAGPSPSGAPTPAEGASGTEETHPSEGSSPVAPTVASTTPEDSAGPLRPSVAPTPGNFGTESNPMHVKLTKEGQNELAAIIKEGTGVV